MKYIVVSGCSYTQEYDAFKDPGSHYDFDKWPDLLRDMFDPNAEVINVAQSGAGNEFIYTSLKENILKIDPKDILIAIAAWSGCMREDWIPLLPSNIVSNKRVITWRSIPSGRNTAAPKDVDFMTARTNNWRWSLGALCKHLDIKFVDFNMLCGTSEESHMKDPMWKILDPNQSLSQQTAKRIGFPSTVSATELLFCSKDDILSYYQHLRDPKSLGRHFINYDSRGSNSYDCVATYSEYTISKDDQHPNIQGHKKIAEWIYDEIQRLGY